MGGFQSTPTFAPFEGHAISPDMDALKASPPPLDQLVDHVWDIGHEKFAEVHAQLKVPRRTPILRAAEDDWLQEDTGEDIESRMAAGLGVEPRGIASTVSSTASQQSKTRSATKRFDWKARVLRRNTKLLGATSRDGADEKPRPPKRYKPPPVVVSPGQPFFSAIEAYAKQYVTASRLILLFCCLTEFQLSEF